MIISHITSLIFFVNVVSSLDNGVARTPPMGWLQWERFRCIIDCETYPNDCVSEKLFTDIANRLSEDGYLEAGYEYVNIDDCWAEHKRDKNMNMVADKKRFPRGIGALADFMHHKGLKMGIYTDFVTKTCGGYPGSIFHMQKDTEQFAKWGIDMVKVDGCYSCNSLMDEGYGAMGAYMNATGRPMLYSCSWPAYIAKDKPYKQLQPMCNIWRNWNDIQDSFDSMMSIANYMGDHQEEFAKYVGPGNFNDPDMLLIGDYSLSEGESQMQMAIWSIMAAPLFISADLRKMKQWQKDILLNKEVIAVNQDPLGLFGKRLLKTSIEQIWMKVLVDGAYSVAIVSTRHDRPVYQTFSFVEYGIEGPFMVRDLFQKKDLGTMATKVTVEVDPNSVRMLKLTPKKKSHTQITPKKKQHKKFERPGKQPHKQVNERKQQHGLFGWSDDMAVEAEKKYMRFHPKRH